MGVGWREYGDYGTGMGDSQVGRGTHVGAVAGVDIYGWEGGGGGCRGRLERQGRQM